MMLNNHDSQRQRHGVTKNLVEGIGGALVGAAAVLLLRSLSKREKFIAHPTGGQGAIRDHSQQRG